ncbi:helix-turn-helix transcriptional regulator [uncultured Oscillibacter sp.]|jgi:transcriptional regulator with XRE-family HTH domain|uniref:helix-turn-helix transcriptional regulator n=1 Tax=uncultured Oscillibacter sp. TaxID=876091 RepID=UPI0026009B36|nr:helix-turn-helix transcriptional regulator [uncultured Oscillibacter sp.]
MGLKEARKRAGLTAKDVALSLGVTFQNVYNWENGSYLPPSKRLPELAKLYGCTVDELLGGGGQDGA